MTDQTATYELFLSRIMSAPRLVVYRAFAEPAQLIQWLGPQGWSVSGEAAQFDVRPGGRQRFSLVKTAESSKCMPVELTLDEVVTGEVITGNQPRRNGPALKLRLEFYEEPGGKTRLELRQGPYTMEQETDARAWWNSSLGRLDILLEGPR